ncbi:hypothetical protein SAMN04487965_2743 [Microbulbifer donghaiensis]|uniref:Uncharacterized protein n=1 Tax=Microbulbifer donghaiensis TaxID=494016 RepID=A0A1M5EMF0_9GAMM|nr:hypothetical protein [Microbulbifer donghaiensis]SHF80468.1 hypothetical protein SAMN04487965_2743 [Microbulbifer donghaiensis]
MSVIETAGPNSRGYGLGCVLVGPLADSKINMKKYRKVVRTLTVFISTFYVLIVAGASGHQDYLSRMVVHEITTLLPMAAGKVEYVIYVAILPLIFLWVVVLRITHVSQEERDIEEFKRINGGKSPRDKRHGFR